ncbi:MAG TPA: SRPBCC family protein [Pseudolabrys sp.]|nr:SRPBCC family protein [Pseudolabrys sp.]
MRIEQQVFVARPIDEVWRFLADVPAVVSCIPGAELGERLSEDSYRGSFRLRVGALSAKIEGEGTVHRDEASRSGSIEGKGADRRGGSRVSTTMSYRVEDAPGGAVVAIAAELSLSGQLWQIGRTGLIEDVAKRLTDEFAEALAARLAADAPASAPREMAAAVQTSFDVGRAIRGSIWSRLAVWVRRLFGGAGR